MIFLNSRRFFYAFQVLFGPIPYPTPPVVYVPFDKQKIINLPNSSPPLQNNPLVLVDKSLEEVGTLEEEEVFDNRLNALLAAKILFLIALLAAPQLLFEVIPDFFLVAKIVIPPNPRYRIRWKFCFSFFKIN